MKKGAFIILLAIILIGALLTAILIKNKTAIILPSQNTANNSNTDTNVDANLVDNHMSFGDIKLPAGFKIDVFADNVDSARLMIMQDNVVYVGTTGTQVYSLADKNNDKKADNVVTFIDGLNIPHSVAYYNGWFYIAENNQLIKVKENSDLAADLSTEQKILDLPKGGEHGTRTVIIHNDKLYISIGSSCDTCQETDPYRAAIIRCDLNGKNCAVFANGLRNSIGMTFKPSTDSLYATENGRADLGDNLPPDEINLIQQGKNYGWPFCYGKNVQDTQFSDITNVCHDKTPSLIDLPAHTAPMALVFYNGSNFPAQYQGKVFVALHSPMAGHKIITVDINTGKITDFAIGSSTNGKALSRPQGLLIYNDGSLLVSDDFANKIYRIYYTG